VTISSRSLVRTAAGAQPKQLEPVAIDPVARPALDVVDDGKQPGVLDVRSPAAARAHDVVVMARLAGDVGVVARRQIDPLDGAKLDEHLQCPKDRRAADTQPTRMGVGKQVRGREMAISGRDQVRNDPPGPGEPVACCAEGEFGGEAGGHPAMIPSLTRPVETQSQPGHAERDVLLLRTGTIVTLPCLFAIGQTARAATVARVDLTA
jgi:hypothetical protein